MFRRMVVAAIAMVALMATPAAAQYDFSVSPGTVAPGGQLTVVGGSCGFNSEVVITMTQVASDGTLGDVVFEETILADDQGNFELTFTVPLDVPDGRYEVAAFCGGEKVASAFVDVVTPGTGTDDDGSGGGPLVRTGSDLNGLGLLGAGLLAAGGVVLVATKARRNHAAS